MTDQAPEFLENLHPRVRFEGLQLYGVRISLFREYDWSRFAVPEPTGLVASSNWKGYTRSFRLTEAGRLVHTQVVYGGDQPDLVIDAALEGAFCLDMRRDFRQFPPTMVPFVRGRIVENRHLWRLGLPWMACQETLHLLRPATIRELRREMAAQAQREAVSRAQHLELVQKARQKNEEWAQALLATDRVARTAKLTGSAIAALAVRWPHARMVKARDDLIESTLQAVEGPWDGLLDEHAMRKALTDGMTSVLAVGDRQTMLHALQILAFEVLNQSLTAPFKDPRTARDTALSYEMSALLRRQLNGKACTRLWQTATDSTTAEQLSGMVLRAFTLILETMATRPG